MAQQIIEASDNLPALRTKLNSNFNEVYAAEVASIGDISDVTLTAPANGDVLTYNGTAWVNGEAVADYLPLSGGTMTGDINLDNNVLMANDTGDGTNIDHIWHDDSANTWHMVSDAAKKSVGNTKLQIGNLSASGGAEITGLTILKDATFKNQLRILRDAALSSYIAYWNTTGEIGSAGFSDAGSWEIRNSGSTIVHSIDSSGNLSIPGQIIHDGDTDTYMQFHNTNQWRVVVGGSEKIEANTTDGVLMSTARVSGTFRIPVK